MVVRGRKRMRGYDRERTSPLTWLVGWSRWSVSETQIPFPPLAKLSTEEAFVEKSDSVVEYQDPSDRLQQTFENGRILHACRDLVGRGETDGVLTGSDLSSLDGGLSGLFNVLTPLWHVTSVA
jgi:hypothetical protein